jgi:nucleoside phosphorylase
MIADRKWMRRNLGFDPITTPPPANTFANAKAAKPSAKPEDFQREIIDFDSESPQGREFLAFSTATGLSRFTDIPWPKGLAPKTGPKPNIGAGPLPKADVLVVTWTVDEGHALSRVLTPGEDSHNNYVPYKHNFAAIAPKMAADSPAVEAKCLATFWTTTIGGKKVVVVKSNSHLSQDTKKLPPPGQNLPNYNVWKQMIQEVNPSLVLTTGTAGGIGTWCEVGDVVVGRIVHFDAQKWLKNASFHNGVYTEQAATKTKYFTAAQKLFKANADQLPRDNTRPPKIVQSTGLTSSVVTTDFFGFDTSDNYYHLKNEGDVSEMGDAVLGLVIQGMNNPPRWLAVRNVSDPQIKAVGTLDQQSAEAAHIYKGFGRWSSICSAIVCWALIAAE